MLKTTNQSYPVITSPSKTLRLGWQGTANKRHSKTGSVWFCSDPYTAPSDCWHFASIRSAFEGCRRQSPCIASELRHRWGVAALTMGSANLPRSNGGIGHAQASSASFVGDTGHLAGIRVTGEGSWRESPGIALQLRYRWRIALQAAALANAPRAHSGAPTAIATSALSFGQARLDET